MAITKAELVENLCQSLGLNKRRGKELVEEVFEELCQCLESGEEIKLSGFGKFVLRDKGARPGRNPKTGEEVTIAPRRVVTFTAGEKLKRRVEQYQGPSDDNNDVLQAEQTNNIGSEVYEESEE